MVEHEHNHLFVGTVETLDVSPNPSEVADWTWMHPDALRDDVAARPARYTSWLRLLLERALAMTPTTGSTSSLPNRGR